MGMKFNFKFQNWEKFYKGFLCKKKRFTDFAETWHTQSSRYLNVSNFRVLVKQLFYGNEIQFQFSKFGKKITKHFNVKKIMNFPSKVNPDQTIYRGIPQ